MRGLIAKDFLALKSQLKIYILILAIWGIMGFFNNDASMIGSFMVMLALLVPISAMAYDEKSKWDSYALTMPVSRLKLVGAKYLLTLIFLVCGGAICFAFSYFISEDFATDAQILITLMGVGLVMMSIVLPIMFKLGVEKGRVAMIIAIMLPVAALIFLPRLNIELPDMSFLERKLWIAPLAGALLFTGSLFLSAAIYKKKEF